MRVGNSKKDKNIEMLTNIPKILFSAFALSVLAYILIFVIALLASNDGTALSISSSRKLFIILYLISLPIVIKFIR